MTFKIIIFTLISGLIGTKKPIYGAIAGAIVAPILSIIHMSAFDPPTVFMLTLFGFGVGLIIGVGCWNLFHGTEYNKQNEKTYFMGMHKSERSGMIYTDEEEKNARENKKTNIK